jgi:hypothetical protein
MVKYICINGIFTIGKIYDIKYIDQPNNSNSEYCLHQIVADDGYPRILPKKYIKQLFISLIDERENKLKYILNE